MARSKRLSSVAKVMQHREQDAARRVGLSAQQRDHQRLRLDELISFKTEYLGQFQSLTKGGTGANVLHDYHQFLNHLELAICQQQQCVEVADNEYESFRREWLTHKSTQKAVDKVVSRYQTQEQVAQSRREQHEIDEYSRYTRGIERD